MSLHAHTTLSFGLSGGAHVWLARCTMQQSTEAKEELSETYEVDRFKLQCSEASHPIASHWCDTLRSTVFGTPQLENYMCAEKYQIAI